MVNLPKELSYSADHEWVNAAPDAIAGATVRVGITEVASDALGEVVFVDAPQVGDTITAGEACGEIESTKSVSDLISPVSGEVVAVNEALEDNPTLVNDDTYGEGWIFEVAATEVGELMDADAYAEQNKL